jgi:hypothetical protein
VEVLDEHDCRPLGNQLFDELDPAGVQPVAHSERMEIACDVESKREAENLALPEPRKQGLGQIALEDPEMLFQNLAKGPVRDALPVREAAPGPTQRLRRFAAEGFPELADQAGFAHAGLAADRHNVGRGLVDDLAVRPCKSG